MSSESGIRGITPIMVKAAEHWRKHRICSLTVLSPSSPHELPAARPGTVPGELVLGAALAAREAGQHFRLSHRHGAPVHRDPSARKKEQPAVFQDLLATGTLSRRRIMAVPVCRFRGGAATVL